MEWWIRRVGRAKRNPSMLSEFAGVKVVGYASLYPPYEAANKLPLPAADAAGLARPGLDRACRAPARRADCCGAAPAWCGRRRAASRRAPALRERPTCRLGRGSAFGTTTRSVFTGLRSVLASIRTGANCVSGPSRFGESTAWERSRPRNSPARYSSASAALPDIRSPVQSAAAIAFFRTITGLLKSTKK